MAARTSLILALLLALSAPINAAEGGMGRVRSLLAAGKPADALAVLRELVRDEPTNAAAHNALGSLLNRSGHYAEALPHAEKAVELDPGNGRYRYNRGVVRAEHGRFADAVADFDAALAAHPDLTYAWLERGAAKLSLNDPAGARSDWAKAAQVEPDLIWVHWYPATGDFLDARFDKAAEAFEKVAAKEAGFSAARLWAAIARERGGYRVALEPATGEWPAPAIEHLRGAISAEDLLKIAAADRASGDARRVAEAHFFIAQAALIRKDAASARRHLEQALAIPSPRHVWRIAAERDLKQL
jgi:tetratricopeptide (TPR) repeat protein